MSSYGSTNVVAVTPYIASQEFRTALRSHVPATLNIPENQPLTTAAVTGLLESARSRGQISPTQATSALTAMARVARTEVATAAAQTLTAMGFHARLTPGSTTTIWAENAAHQVMAVEVHDGGGFAFDLAGIEGGACHEIVAQFHAGMTARGITYTPTAITHNDPRGGQLIRRVTRRANPQAKGGRTSGQRRATQ